MEIGKAIRMVRVAKNMTQTELFTKCNLSRGYISQLETGNREPSLSMLRTIAEALGVSVTTLVALSELKKNDGYFYSIYAQMELMNIGRDRND